MKIVFAFLGLLALAAALPKGEKKQQDLDDNANEEQIEDSPGKVGIQGSNQIIPHGYANTLSSNQVTLPTGTHILRAIVCEGKTSSIYCTSGYRLNIHYANYGRTESGVCGYYGAFKRCRSTHSAALFGAYCQYKSVCTFTASNKIFGDPCVGIPKYVELIFSCLKP